MEGDLRRFGRHLDDSQQGVKVRCVLGVQKIAPFWDQLVRQLDEAIFHLRQPHRDAVRGDRCLGLIELVRRERLSLDFEFDDLPSSYKVMAVLSRYDSENTGGCQEKARGRLDH